MAIHARRMISWLATFALFSATTAQGGDEGENFVTLYSPDAAEWELVQDPNRRTTRLWKHKRNEKDQLRIEVFRGSADTLAEARMTLDGPGKLNCSSFDTTTIRESRVNGYPRLLWRTDCARDDDAKTTLLQLAVRGRDSLYLAMKVWPFDVADAEVETWTERFERFFVCDTRTQDHPCPEGVEAIE